MRYVQKMDKVRAWRIAQEHSRAEERDSYRCSYTNLNNTTARAMLQTFEVINMIAMDCAMLRAFGLVGVMATDCAMLA